MISHWAYILIGENNTGKTTFQRKVVYELCDKTPSRLAINKIRDINHPRMPRGVRHLFAMNRSYQERASEYASISEYFNKDFKFADICLLSFHTHGSSYDDVGQMIIELRRHAYNVAAIFFSNNYTGEAEQIAQLTWDERLWIDNPRRDSEDDIRAQIEWKAGEFVNFLINRSTTQ